MQICHQRCTRYSHDILGRQLGFVTGGSVGFPHRSLVFFGWICINCLFKKCGFLSRFVCYRSHRPKGTMQVETRNFLVSWVFSLFLLLLAWSGKICASQIGWFPQNGWGEKNVKKLKPSPSLYILCVCDHVVQTCTWHNKESAWVDPNGN